MRGEGGGKSLITLNNAPLVLITLGNGFEHEHSWGNEMAITINLIKTM